MKCCDISAGMLKQPIIIERATKTPDGSGGHTVVWATVASPRALVRPVSGRERVWGDSLEANVTHRIMIRYRSGLLPADRIKLGTRTMQIRAILDLEEAHKWIEIQAEEGVAT